MIEGTTCSCRGENSNCFKCDGTGYYKKNTNTPRSYDLPFREGGPHKPTKETVRPRSVRRTERPLRTEKTVVCGTCGDKLSGFKALDKHETEKHPKPVRPAREPVRPSGHLNVTGRAERPKVRSNAVQAKSLNTPQPKTACPVCGKMLKNAQGVQMHLEVVHPAAQAAAPKGKLIRSVHPRVPQKQPGREIRDTGYTATRETRESYLDGSRDYYDRFLEGNRLGSHPSHDDYGDESFS